MTAAIPTRATPVWHTEWLESDMWHDIWLARNDADELPDSVIVDVTHAYRHETELPFAAHGYWLGTHYRCTLAAFGWHGPSSDRHALATYEVEVVS